MTGINVDCCKFEYNVPTAKLCTFKIGGVAAEVAYPETPTAFAQLIRKLKKQNIAYTVLGNGSNVLFPDGGYGGVIVMTKKLCGVSVSDNMLRVGSGASLTAAAKIACESSLSGLEFAYGIPGSAGGGVYMNAGAYGGNLSDAVNYSLVCDTDGNAYRIYSSEHCFSYRDSIFQHEELYVLETGFRLASGSESSIKAAMDDYMGRRKSKQPLDLPSAGSVFKRGEGFITSQIIDECGLKGLRIGDAQVSEKHAGFIVNLGHATAEDVIMLIRKVKEKVFSETGKTIECEIKMLGGLKL